MFYDSPERVRFTHMEALGHNPARIIPAWREFIEEQVSAAGPGEMGLRFMDLDSRHADI